MAKDLKKFVNISFLRAVDLKLMRELLGRHATELRCFDLADFDRKPSEVREILQNQNGLQLLLERAAALKKELIPKQEAEGQHVNPKHVALRAFLEHPDVFEAASDYCGSP